jgi:beta-lactamase regulating signal transducer with metallopeptidase domain
MNALEHLREADMIYRLGWTLVHSLWLGAAVAALLWVTLALLRRRLPQTRYLAACVAMILMVVAPLVTFPWVSAPAQAPVAVERGGPAAATLPDVPASPRLPAASGPASTPPVSAADQGHEGFGAAVVRASHTLEPALPWMTLAWLCGVLALSLWRLAGWVGVQRLRRRAAPPSDPAPAERLKSLARTLRVSRPVRLMESALVRVPVVIGWLRPVILLPAGLAHELAHIRRLDYLVNLLQMAAETALFYHPAVWWVSRRIRTERENCCDDMAVAVLGNPVGYVEALAAVADLDPPPSREPASQAAAVALGKSGHDLVGRVRRLLGLPDPARSPSAASATAILLVVAGLAASITVGVACRAAGTQPGAGAAVIRVGMPMEEAMKVLKEDGAPAAKPEATGFIKAEDDGQADVWAPMAKGLCGKAAVVSTEGLNYTVAFVLTNTGKEAVVIDLGPREGTPSDGSPGYTLPPGVGMAVLLKGNWGVIDDRLRLGDGWKQPLRIQPGERYRAIVEFGVSKEVKEKCLDAGMPAALKLHGYDGSPATISGDWILPLSVTPKAKAGADKARADGGPARGLFERYVEAFRPRPPKGGVVPVLEPLPEDVYASTVTLAKQDGPRFREGVCLYLAKYHLYYLKECHQTYSLVAPNEVQRVVPGNAANGKFFMLNAFLGFSGIKVGRDDGVPSNAVIAYCRAEMKGSKVIADLLDEVVGAERANDPSAR